jgi:hypothetical protein
MSPTPINSRAAPDGPMPFNVSSEREDHRHIYT